MKTAAFTLILMASLIAGCNKDKNIYNPVPGVPVYIQFNIDNPGYYKLENEGGWMYMDGGVKGIVVIHNYDDQIYALDRACPYNYQDSCAQINVENSGLFLRCGHYDQYDTKRWIPCCNSEFDLTGGVVNGPAKYPMRAYKVQISGSLITITN